MRWLLKGRRTVKYRLKADKSVECLRVYDNADEVGILCCEKYCNLPIRLFDLLFEPVEPEPPPAQLPPMSRTAFRYKYRSLWIEGDEALAAEAIDRVMANRQ